MTNRAGSIVEQLRTWGLTLPGAHRKSPWPDHDDLAVKDKTFAYLPARGKPFALSCKLPYTGYEALQLPYAGPNTLRSWQERLGQLPACRRSGPCDRATQSVDRR